MEFAEMKEHIDLFLRNTNFETEYCYKYVEDDPFNRDTIDGLTIWRKGMSPRSLVACVKDVEHLHTIEEFILTFMKMPLRQEDIFQLEKGGDIELIEENAPSVYVTTPLPDFDPYFDPFLDSDELP